MDRVSNPVEERLYELLVQQLDLALNRAYPFVVRGDLGAIANLSWNLQNQFQIPIFAAWQGGWAAGGRQMVEEVQAAIPQEVLDQFALASWLKKLIRRLFTLPPEPLEDSPALQAVRDRAFVLAGSFADSQLKRLKQDLIDSIEPDANGKILSRKELEKRIQDNLRVGRARAATIAQTETTKAYNTGRIQTALQSQLVTHFRYIAIDDQRTTDICQTRNGLVIPRDRAAEFMPPAHYRCRSTISPLMPDVNPRHQAMVDDPNRNPANRELAPLPKGWNV
jgi:SPP1 gp7 family putative phage head morphogenesis protein